MGGCGRGFTGQQPAPALLCHVRRRQGRKLWAWDVASEHLTKNLMKLCLGKEWIILGRILSICADVWGHDGWMFLLVMYESLCKEGS